MDACLDMLQRLESVNRTCETCEFVQCCFSIYVLSWYARPMYVGRCPECTSRSP